MKKKESKREIERAVRSERDPTGVWKREDQRDLEGVRREHERDSSVRNRM